MSKIGQYVIEAQERQPELVEQIEMREPLMQSHPSHPDFMSYIKLIKRRLGHVTGRIERLS